ncbi:MAG: glycosyltransferase, partial [Pyrinomonadaceae bacterium]
MKVLQLGPYPPPHGGVQTNLVAIRQFLRERGVACPVINLTRYRRPQTEDIYYPESAAQVVKLIPRLRPDIIHMHIGGNVSPRLLGLGLVCCLMPQSKTVLTLHSGGYPTSEAGRTARPATARGFIFRRFDRIIAVNEEIVAMFHRFGVARERVRLIPPHAVRVPPPGVKLPEPMPGFFDAH